LGVRGITGGIIKFPALGKEITAGLLDYVDFENKKGYRLLVSLAGSMFPDALNILKPYN